MRLWFSHASTPVGTVVVCECIVIFCCSAVHIDVAPKYLQPFVDSHIIWATVGSSATDVRLHCGVGDTFGSAKHVALVATYAQAPADSQVLLAILLGKPVTEGQLVMPVGMVPLVVFAPMQLSSAISSAVTLVGGGALALLDSSAHSAAHAAVALHAAICTAMRSRLVGFVSYQCNFQSIGNLP